MNDRSELIDSAIQRAQHVRALTVLLLSNTFSEKYTRKIAEKIRDQMVCQELELAQANAIATPDAHLGAIEP